jgi:acetyl esterase/lipase
MASAFGIVIEKSNISGVAVAWLGPSKITPENANRLFIHVHGGAYVSQAGDAAFYEGIMIASRLGIPVLSIDYRMPPDHPFPAAVDDVVAVYSHLLKSRAPKAMMIGGTSSGGGLALASVHKFRQKNLPAPAGVFAGTAWADLTKTGDTLYTNEGLDRILITYDGLLKAAAKLYAGGHDMKDPLISPVYGDFKGFPPVILVTGTRDLFLSDVVRTHRKLRAAGVAAELHVYEGMSHADYAIVANSPESLDMYRELGNFVSRHLAQ